MQLHEKTYLITGIASKHSIAYGIAQTLVQAGARLVLWVQTPELAQKIRKLCADWPILTLDVVDMTRDEDLQDACTRLPALDGVLHAAAFAPAYALQGAFHEVTDREAFAIAHEVSSYSFLALVKATLPYWKDHSSALTLTYIASQRTMPNYNVMGLAKASLEAQVRTLACSLGALGHRVNAISAGPVRTLAASGIQGFRQMLEHNAQKAPLQRNVTQEDLGKAAAFLLSDWASGITGEILHVDAGVHCTA